MAAVELLHLLVGSFASPIIVWRPSWRCSEGLCRKVMEDEWLHNGSTSLHSSKSDLYYIRPRLLRRLWAQYYDTKNCLLSKNCLAISVTGGSSNCNQREGCGWASVRDCQYNTWNDIQSFDLEYGWGQSRTARHCIKTDRQHHGFWRSCIEVSQEHNEGKLVFTSICIVGDNVCIQPRLWSFHA